MPSASSDKGRWALRMTRSLGGESWCKSQGRAGVAPHRLRTGLRALQESNAWVCSGQVPTTAGQVLGKELLPRREPGVPLTVYSPPQLGSAESGSHAGDGAKHRIESGADTRPIPNPGKAGFEKRRNWQNVI